MATSLTAAAAPAAKPTSPCARAGGVTAVEVRSARPASRVIDARGPGVSPGFIDIHTRSDFTLPLKPSRESKIRQGVTLEVTGNRGFSVGRVLVECVSTTIIVRLFGPNHFGGSFGATRSTRGRHVEVSCAARRKPC